MKKVKPADPIKAAQKAYRTEKREHITTARILIEERKKLLSQIAKLHEELHYAGKCIALLENNRKLLDDQHLIIKMQEKTG